MDPEVRRLLNRKQNKMALKYQFPAITEVLEGDLVLTSEGGSVYLYTRLGQDLYKTKLSKAKKGTPRSSVGGAGYRTLTKPVSADASDDASNITLSNELKNIISDIIEKLAQNGIK
tara:strand:- start:485 stop:832 length:348 start_codon:yes stop_codon:yes gene_type:complete